MNNKYEKLEIKDFADKSELIDSILKNVYLLKQNPDDCCYDLVSVYGKYEFIYSLLKYFITETDLEVGSININRFYYDEEYCLNILDNAKITVGKARNDEFKPYNIYDELCYFNQDDCKQDLIDKSLEGDCNYPILFGIGEDEKCNCDCCDCVQKNSTSSSVKSNVSSVYRVNGKEVSKNEFEIAEKEIKERFDDFDRTFRRNTLALCEAMDSVNELRKWFW